MPKTNIPDTAFSDSQDYLLVQRPHPYRITIERMDDKIPQNEKEQNCMLTLYANEEAFRDIIGVIRKHIGF